MTWVPTLQEQIATALFMFAIVLLLLVLVFGKKLPDEDTDDEDRWKI